MSTLDAALFRPYPLHYPPRAPAQEPARIRPLQPSEWLRCIAVLLAARARDGEEERDADAAARHNRPCSVSGSPTYSVDGPFALAKGKG